MATASMEGSSMIRRKSVSACGFFPVRFASASAATARRRESMSQIRTTSTSFIEANPCTSDAARPATPTQPMRTRSEGGDFGGASWASDAVATDAATKPDA
jgi:hypothetical protein